MAHDDTDRLHIANVEAGVMLDGLMSRGEPSRWRKFKELLSPVGNDVGLACLLTGCDWYVNERTTDGRLTCFCVRCGGGAYFPEDDPPAMLRHDRDTDPIPGAQFDPESLTKRRPLLQRVYDPASPDLTGRERDSLTTDDSSRHDHDDS